MLYLNCLLSQQLDEVDVICITRDTERLINLSKITKLRERQSQDTNPGISNPQGLGTNLHKRPIWKMSSNHREKTEPLIH